MQPEQLEAAKPGEYGPNDAAGQAGLELQYERWLRGRKGLQRYVVNSDGERIRDLGGREPTAGGDLVLTMDGEWQRAAEDALYETHPAHPPGLDEDRGTNFKADAGVVVVLDVETGGVKAMASWPDYDPRWYVTGLTKDQVCYLGYSPKCQGANEVAPLLNRAYQEVYLPGSTFKPFTALAAVKEGYAYARTRRTTARPSYVHPGDESDTDFENWSDARTSGICRSPRSLIGRATRCSTSGDPTSGSATRTTSSARTTSRCRSTCARGASRSRPASTCRVRRAASCPTRNGATTPISETSSAGPAGIPAATSSR